MTSRINIARPAGVSGGYQPDPHGFGNSRPSGGYRAANPDDPLEKFRMFARQVEDNIDISAQPLKPYLPAIGRFLIVVTFLEDSVRIVTQWSDQLWYLQRHRHFPWGLSHIFLALNVVLMLVGAGSVIAKRYAEYATIALTSVVIMQALGYGLIFDLSFFLRNLSVMGGLLMVFSDTIYTRGRASFAGIPTLSETDRKKYFLLAGRILLIFLFIGFAFRGEWSFARVFVSLVGLAACTMVAVGFKAKWASAFLVLVLSVFNVFINNFWSIHSAHPQRDFLKYDFFQTLSIVGGLILLVQMGPGGLSVDEKKKIY
ncbi:SURF4 family-domain-containing protein [Cytidiella melzeri]|nr:SURF4 family-domain-containing protein [Cytidiella melzeri]